jgi:DNA-binding transcriptional ArsR family regulator
MLRPGELCVCQIAAVLGLAVSTVSAHLAELRRAGLLVERKDGRWVSYRTAEDRAARAVVERVWDLVGGDRQLAADARLGRSLRRIPVEMLPRGPGRRAAGSQASGGGPPGGREDVMETPVAINVIEILGPGCPRCHETYRVVKHVVEQAGLPCVVQKNDVVGRMVELGVRRAPAVVVDVARGPPGERPEIRGRAPPPGPELNRRATASRCASGPSCCS